MHECPSCGYDWETRHGVSNHIKEAHPQESLALRIALHTEEAGADECWRWTGTIRRGYPQISRNNKVTGVSRALLGLYDPSQFALHSCDESWCVNPSHLRVGTSRKKPPEECLLLARTMVDL